MTRIAFISLRRILSLFTLNEEEGCFELSDQLLTGEKLGRGGGQKRGDFFAAATARADEEKDACMSVCVFVRSQVKVILLPSSTHPHQLRMRAL